MNDKKPKILTEGELLVDRSLLSRAREYIESGDERFICFAVFRSVGALQRQKMTSLPSHVQLLAGSWRVRDWILNMLKTKKVSPEGSITYEEYNYLDVWMRNCHIDLVANLPDSEYRNKIRQTRLAWIDWMLGEIDRELETVRAVAASVPSTPSDCRIPANP